MSLPSDEYMTQPHMAANAMRGSAALLNALKAHHDFNIYAPEDWKAREPEPEVEPEPVIVFPPAKPIWFSFDDPEEKPAPKIRQIKMAACAHFQVSPIDLISKRRTKEVVYPRQVAYFVAKSLTTHTLPEIARKFGGRDHTTILYGVRKIERLARQDWRVAYDVAHVEGML